MQKYWTIKLSDNQAVKLLIHTLYINLHLPTKVSGIHHVYASIHKTKTVGRGDILLKGKQIQSKASLMPVKNNFIKFTHLINHTTM